MNAPRLSPAMRNMLRSIVDGKGPYEDLVDGIKRGGHLKTRNALCQRGLIDAADRATLAGRAVFAPNFGAPNRSYEVWHLVGPQACGKTRWAREAEQVIADHGGCAYLMDVHSFGLEFTGNPERVADAVPGITVLLLEHNDTPTAALPPHYMRGERVIDLTDYLTARRPGVYALQTRLRLENPTWPEAKVITAAKALVTSTHTRKVQDGVVSTMQTEAHHA